MKIGPQKTLDPSVSRLVSVLVMTFGMLLILLGGLMVYELSDVANVNIGGSVALMWGGSAIMAAGFAVRRNQRLMLRPRWVHAAFIFGIISSLALPKTVATGDTVGTIGMLLMQAIAIFCIWKGCWQR